MGCGLLIVLAGCQGDAERASAANRGADEVVAHSSEAADARAHPTPPKQVRVFEREEGSADGRAGGASSPIALLALDSTAHLGDRDPLPELEPPLPADGGARPVFERPEYVRGLYINASTAGSTRRMRDLVGLALRSEVNAFVIDIKDVTGYISHRSQVPLAKEIGATSRAPISNLLGLLR